MKIGIDCRLWNQTGVGRYIRNLVYGIDTNTSDHTFILYLLKDEYDSLTFNNPKIEKRLANITWHSVQEQVLFPKIVAKDNLDLMHFTYYSVPIFYNRPFVITLHDVIISYFDTGEASTLPLPIYKGKRMVYSYILSHATRKAKKIIVPLESTLHDVVRLYPSVKDKIVVTKEGFDHKILEEGKISRDIKDAVRKPFLLYVGNAYPHKNVPALLKAFQMFKSENTSDIKLLLVGKDDYFYKKIKKSFTEDIIHLKDISDYELGHLYKNALALVLPSHMEGFGLPALEAMSVGCLVAAADIPAFQEVCGNSAIYFDPGNAQGIKNTLMRITQMTTNEKEKYILNAQKKSASYSWKKMVEETIAVYDTVHSS